MAAKPPKQKEGGKGLLLTLLPLVKRRTVSLPCSSTARRKDRLTKYSDQLKLNLPAGNQEMPVPRLGGVSVYAVRDPGSVYGQAPKLVWVRAGGQHVTLGQSTNRSAAWVRNQSGA